jgi:hypothetical protein
MRSLRRLAVQNLVLISSAHTATKLLNPRTHKIKAVQLPFPSDEEEKTGIAYDFRKLLDFLILKSCFLG